MAVIRGFNGTLSADASPVGELRSWNYTRSGTEEDTSVMGVTRVSLGNIAVTGALTVYLNSFAGTDPAQDAGQALLKVGDEVVAVLRPNGVGAGKPELTGTILITEQGASAEQDGQVEGTFNFQLQNVDDWVETVQV